MSLENRPNLFIVGAQKAGTSALAGWLSQHPDVCLSFPKEPGYLAFGSGGYWFPDGFGKPAPASRYVVRDEASYLRLFAGASARQPVVGEASTWYLVTPGMPEKLRAFSPEARIIVILRNPVERAYSAWCHARRDGVEPCARFADALAAEARRGEVEYLLRYRRMGLYAADLQRYQSVFPRDKLLVLFYDELRASPAALWREVCDFLGIDRAFVPPFDSRYNRGGEPRSRTLQRVMRSQALRRGARALVPHRLGLAIKGRLDAINLRRLPPLAPQIRDELRAYYRDDIAQTERLTGRDLADWLS